jgi:integrase
MMEMGSLVYQIESAFSVIFTPGASRHVAKRRGEADQYIYSFATLGKYLRVCNDSVRWVKGRYAISRLGDLEPHMVMAFIRLRQSEPLPNGRLRSPNTINGYLDALSKLDTAIRAKGWRRASAPPLVDLALRVRHGPPRPTPFTPEETQAMDECLQKYPDPRVALVARAMRLGGLRLDEAVRLRVSEIQDDRLRLDGHSCKNGRPREVPLTPDAVEFFQQLKTQAGERPLVFETVRLRGLVQRVVKATAETLGITDRRSHNFRAHYANELYRRLRADGISDRRARRTVAAALGHGRLSVLKHYLSPSGEKDDVADQD